MANSRRNFETGYTPEPYQYSPDPAVLWRYLDRELVKISAAFAQSGRWEMPTLHVEPEKPREGMIVQADGTDWDPGSGAGVYQYTGGAWVFRSPAPVTNHSLLTGLQGGTTGEYFHLTESEYLNLGSKTPMTGIESSPAGTYTSTLTYNETTRTVTISPTGSTFNVYVNGQVFTKTAQSLAHAATGAAHFFYFDSSGNLVTSTSPWDLLLHAPVAFVFQDATNGRRICFEERHHAGRDIWWHRNQHFAEGTKAPSGFTASDITGYTLATGTDAACTFALASGVLADEDIEVTTEAVPDGGPYVILSRQGAAGDWQMTRANTVPFNRSGTTLQFNEFTGGVWQWTSVTNNDFVNMYVFGATALPQASVTPSPGAVQQIVMIPGQAKFTSLAAADVETTSSLNWGTLPFQELVALFKLTYKFSSGGGGTVSLEKVQRIVGERLTDVSSTPIDHGTLAGLLDDDHTLYTLVDGSRSFTLSSTNSVGIAGTTSAINAFYVSATVNNASPVGVSFAPTLVNIDTVQAIGAQVNAFLTPPGTNISNFYAFIQSSHKNAGGDVTNWYGNVSRFSTTSSAAGTVSNFVGYSVFAPNLVGGSTAVISTHVGFSAEALSTASTIYGFQGKIAASTNRYNLYMNGTADNYLAGRLGVGTTPNASANITSQYTASGASTKYNTIVTTTISSDVTALFISVPSLIATQAASFTLLDCRHFSADQGTIGASSVINNQYGFAALGTLVGAITNYGFFCGNASAITAGKTHYAFRSVSNIATGGGSCWNIYIDGTAPNYLAGDLRIGTTTQSGVRLTASATFTSTSADEYVAYVLASATQSSGANAKYAIIGQISTNTGFASTGAISGLFGTVTHNLTNTLSVARGCVTFLNNASTGTISVADNFTAVNALNSGTISALHGFHCNNLAAGVANYGFRGEVVAASGRWNLYMDGTANNAIAGSTRFGSTTPPVNTVDITGSFGVGTPVTKVADFTWGASENWIINNKSGSTCVVTLPAAASFTGRVLYIKNIQAQLVNSASSNVVPRAGGAAGTAILAATAGAWATLVSDGTNWVIMQGS